jgi:hypothetical protein
MGPDARRVNGMEGRLNQIGTEPAAKPWHMVCNSPIDEERCPCGFS